MKELQKKEFIIEIMKKINEKKRISAQEEKFVKIVENEHNKNLLIKQKIIDILPETLSPIIKNKNSQPLSQDMKISPNQSIVKTPNTSKNKSFIRLKSGFWNNLNNSNKQTSNLIKSPKNNFEKFRPDNFMNELRDNISIAHEKMKEQIQKDLNFSKLIYKKINSRVTEEVNEKKHQK